MRHLLRLVCALLALALCTPAPAYDRITGKTFASRSEVIARNGMAATSQPLATQAAIEILQRGGNAIDAAIAANAVLAVVEPVACGLGGDLFAIVWDARGKRLHGINGSGRSPAALTLQYLQAQGLKSMPPRGPLPVTVPGAVDAWFELHARFGHLSMSEILAPAIRYARGGYPVSELVAYYWNLSVPLLEPWAGFRDGFMPGGRAPRKGEIFRNPALANTLEVLARDGRDAFYRGPIARTIDAFMRREGGFLYYEDLDAHHSEWVDPVSTSYRGYDVWELPPNGQGIAVLQLLNILEGFDLKSMGAGSVDYLHTFVEAKKLVYEDRAKFYADPAFNRIPVKGLIAKDYAAQRRALIDPQRAAKRLEAGQPALERGDTTYLATADLYGNMVSLIQSNYRGMGSGLAPDGLGFILQDRGELFDLAEGRANTYAPRKRPFHTIIPGFVTRNGEAFMSFGVMGGATQPQAQAQVLVNIIDFGMNVQEAGDAARFIHQGSSQPTGQEMTDGGTLALESGIPAETARELARKGHRIVNSVGAFGGYQAIRRDAATGVYFGASESRKDGQAAGY